MKNSIKRALVYAQENPGKKIRYATLEGNFDIVFTKPVLDGSDKGVLMIIDDLK